MKVDSVKITTVSVATSVMVWALASAAMLTGCGTSGSGATAAPSANPPAVGTASPAPAAVPSRAEIAGLFDTWNDALATGDPQKVADLYAPDAVLLPTVSNQIRTNRAEIVDYFTSFLKSHPQGVIETEVINPLDSDTAINTGIYRFTLTKDGEPQQVRARYTYVYEREDGRWLIVNHQSSVMPEG